MKREPGASQDVEGKTGTVPRQHGTAASTLKGARPHGQGIGQAAVMIGWLLLIGSYWRAVRGVRVGAREFITAVEDTTA